MSSSDLAIAVRGVSKSYTIAHNAPGHSTAIEALLHKVRHPRERAAKETFWALKEIDFEVKKGEVVGVIGRNGAGKSTLLKLLSRITEPTTGSIELYGRLGSLLEVGTGFHPELTGRENVFLNGSILGMTRKEIERQFDAIVAFAGVEQFLDTPVKRYSSGMYVRLAFAVAAHLNPDILIVDEVLAVGDAEFQKKCLGAMKDVANSGRTVLFVSHQMQAINALCTSGIYLDKGRIGYMGDVQTTIQHYMSVRQTQQLDTEATKRPGSGEFRFTNFTTDKGTYLSTDDIQLDLEITRLSNAQPNYFISLELQNAYGLPVLHLDSRLLNQEYDRTDLRRLRWTIRESRLAQGDYRMSAVICSSGGVIDRIEGAAEITIAPILPYPTRRNDCAWHAAYYPEFEIEEVAPDALELPQSLVENSAS
jgi:lipopolysaccharide transport system ATP-binding protein